MTVESMRRRRHCVVFERGDISDRCWRRAIDKRSGGWQRQSACRCDLRVFRCRSPESPLSNSMTKWVAISGVGRPWSGVRCARRSSALGVRQTATRRTDAPRVWSKYRRSMGSQVTRAPDHSAIARGDQGDPPSPTSTAPPGFGPSWAVRDSSVNASKPPGRRPVPDGVARHPVARAVAAFVRYQRRGAMAPPLRLRLRLR